MMGMADLSPLLLTAWCEPPTILVLPNEGADLWRIDGIVSERLDVHGLLAEEEAARAARFRHARDRNAYINTRAALRTLLGRYLDETPTSLVFEYGRFGKPRLARLVDRPELRFNVSHSGTVALIAIAIAREVGIDVEEVRPLPDIPEMVSLYFAESERDRLIALPEETRTAEFFRLWTLKEAHLKAMGIGWSQWLSSEPDSDRTSATIGESASCGRVPGRWTSRSLALGPDYAGAVVAEGVGTQFRLFATRSDVVPPATAGDGG